MANPPFGFGAGQAPDPFVKAHETRSPIVNMQPQGQGATTPSAFSPQTNLLLNTDMSVLDGISPERLAAIARLFQSGALQMPPAAPPFPTQGQSAGLAPPAMPLPGISRSSRLVVEAEEVGADAEEGEVDESEEEYSPAQARDFLRPPPTGPRKRSVSPRGAAPSIKRRKASPTLSTNTQRTPAKHHRPTPSGRQLKKGGDSNKKEAAILFVREMVQAGYGYEDLASAVGEPAHLAQMFREMNLPLHGMSTAHHPPHTNGIEGFPGPPQPPPILASANEETGKTSAKRAAPAKPVPVDRSAYLAKLQAAKNKKADLSTASGVATADPGPGAKLVTPTETPKTADLLSSEGGVKMQMTPLSASKAASMTELARQRLEALKAKNAAEKANAKTSYVPNRHRDSSPFRGGLGAGIADLAAKAGQTAAQHIHDQSNQAPVLSQSMPSSALITPTRSFSGLPGLFMGGSVPNPTVTTSSKPDLVPQTPLEGADVEDIPATRTHTLPGPATGSASPWTVSRKRAVAADFDDAAINPLPAKRPFVQDRPEREDEGESFVIDVSDYESEEEIDDVRASNSNTTMPTKSLSDMGPLRDFPPTSSFLTPASAPRTPDGVTYEQKMKEIEEYKRIIAAKEKKKKANGRAANLTPEATFVSGSAVQATSDEHDATPPQVQQVVHADAQAGGNQQSSKDIIPQAAPQSAAPNGQTPPAATSVLSKVGLTIDKDLLREKLRQRMAVLGQEIRMSSPAKQITASEPQPESEHVMSGALPSEGAASSGSNGSLQPSLPTVLGAESKPEEDSKSEEGELSESSSPNFYEMEDVEERGDQHTVDYYDPNPMTTHISGQSETAMAAEVQSATPDELEDSALEPSNSDRDDDILDDDEHDDRDDDDDESDAMSIDSQESFTELHATSHPTQATGDPMSMNNGSSAQASRRSSTSSASDVDQAMVQYAAPTESRAGDVTSENTPDNSLGTEPRSSNIQLPIALDRDQTQARQYFTPYRSPLEGFKDYRYHPEYLNTVPGGYTSTTYNHKIDSENAMCPFETAGGKCNDTTCQFQHFKAMEVSGTDLINAMVTKNLPVHTSDEQQRWDDGLGCIIQQLRQDNASPSAATIASKIAEYRREFVGDPTKTLNLD